MPKTRDELIFIGSRHSTTAILAESPNTMKRWDEDIEILAPWGWGANRRARLESLVGDLDARHQLYLTQLGDKLIATPAVRAAFKALRLWSYQALSIMHDLTQQDDDIAKRIWSAPSRACTCPITGLGVASIFPVAPP